LYQDFIPLSNATGLQGKVDRGCSIRHTDRRSAKELSQCLLKLLDLCAHAEKFPV
jgi:hypothetical protein